MRSLIFPFILAGLICADRLSAQVSTPRMLENTGKIAQDYYRVNPFNKDFSQFLVRLTMDPALRDSQVLRKTDTTLYFVQGLYRNHQPFFFPAEKVRMVLAEREIEKDSSGIPESLFIYQLVGYAKPGEDGLADIRKEYEKLSRKLGKMFDMSHPREIRSGEQVQGEIRDFYFTDLPFAPLTIAWSQDSTQGNICAITLRFQVYNNRAFLPVTTYRF